MVKIGDKLVDYNTEFKVFLCTRNSDIIMTPSESGLLNMINFTVTKSGLEGKLLSIIINYE
jgi:dynein heavy chain 2, cytosolic